MGLDMVELVMEIEEYCGISIPDPEAEKIMTVQDMVDTVAKHLHDIRNSTALRDRIFNQLAGALQKSGLATHSPVLLTDLVSSYILPGNPEAWQALREELKLEVPIPHIAEPLRKNIQDKIKQAAGWPLGYDWLTITLDQLVAVICAGNIDVLVCKDEIHDRYEIYTAVMAITVGKTGIDFYEIAPEKSFTTDLGLD